MTECCCQGADVSLPWKQLSDADQCRRFYTSLVETQMLVNQILHNNTNNVRHRSHLFNTDTWKISLHVARLSYKEVATSMIRLPMRLLKS